MALLPPEKEGAELNHLPATLINALRQSEGTFEEPLYRWATLLFIVRTEVTLSSFFKGTRREVTCFRSNMYYIT